MLSGSELFGLVLKWIEMLLLVVIVLLLCSGCCMGLLCGGYVKIENFMFDELVLMMSSVSVCIGLFSVILVLVVLLMLVLCVWCC